MAKKTIAILLFDEVEVLDFGGPYEVFAASRDESDQPYCQVFTVAARPEVKCYGGLRVLADFDFQNCPAFDVLIVPGGPGARLEIEKQASAIRFIQERAAQGKLIASVCTGSYLLALAGLLDGQRATTHTARLADFAARFPAIKVVKEKVVDGAQVMTAGGVSSGIDLALFLLERWFGPDARRREAVRLDGPW